MPNETRVHETFTNNPVIQKWITKMSLSLYVSPPTKSKTAIRFHCDFLLFINKYIVICTDLQINACIC
jgi:hypothetical protein